MYNIYILIDLIIAGICYLAIGSIVAGFVTIVMYRRWIIGFVLLSFGVSTILFFSYGILVEPNTIEVIEQTVDIEDYSGEPFDIVLMSDLHVGRLNNDVRLKKATEKIRSLNNIEAVLILGDMVNISSDNFDDLNPLREISEEINVYAVYGNHDYTNNKKSKDTKTLVPGLNAKLEALGVQILDNESERIVLSDGGDVIVGGISDIWANDYDFDFTKDLSPKETFLMLIHNPDGVMTISNEMENPEVVDLVVSGHTHGGEIRLPFIGAVTFLPIELPRDYDQGLFEYEGIPLFITSGIGSIGARLRIMNPPEIVVLTII